MAQGPCPNSLEGNAVHFTITESEENDRKRRPRQDHKCYRGIGEVNREELAWAAGFFDGEGNIGCQVKNHTATFRIHVSQVRLEPLERFQRAVLGLGKIVQRQRESRTHYGQKPVYEFRTGGFQESQAIMAMLASFLSQPKQEQLISALQTYKDCYEPYI